MKKYLAISKIYFKNQLIWRSDVLLSLLFLATRILFAYLLWGSIFESRETMGGFTFETMLLYYVISSLLSQIDVSGRVSNEITAMIRNGRFSGYMVIPIDTEGYFRAMAAGIAGLYLLLNLAAAGGWILLFKIPLPSGPEPAMLVAAVLLIAGGLYFMLQLNYFLGILTLKFEEISTFLMIKDNLIQLVCGGLIPLVFLPLPLLAAMKFLPFYYVSYLPAMLLLGRAKEEAVTGVMVMTGWCLFFAILNKVMYERLRIKYDGVGI